MRIAAIYGSQRRGSTYHMAHAVIDQLAPPEERELSEFFLSKEIPQPCMGCFTCISRGAELCPHWETMRPILEAVDAADVIVLSSATYVYDVTGQMKIFLDHLAYRWMVHRPSPGMFHKVGIAVSSSAGGGHGRTCATLRINMEYWGMARVFTLPAAVQAASWEGVSAEKKARIHRRAGRIAARARAAVRRQRKPTLKVRSLFFFMGRLVKLLSGKTGGADSDYWKAQGWQDGGKPW